ncbi:MAG TPA: YwqG family protein, partial [Burkholderiales bacterium]|nr:YwqG family protein [Burkholderiales bacterium]
MKEIEASSGREIDYGAYSDLARALFRAAAPTAEGPHHRFGGYSENLQGDMQLEAELVTHGLYCGDETGYNDPRAKTLAATCEQWALLLQLDSNDAAGVMWGDMGMLYYWIRSADLAARDFSKSWM